MTGQQYGYEEIYVWMGWVLGLHMHVMVMYEARPLMWKQQRICVSLNSEPPTPQPR